MKLRKGAPVGTWNKGTGRKRRGESPDWFYALGGLTWWLDVDGSVTFEDASPRIASVRMAVTLHVYDKYDWDAGKGVEIGPIAVRDEELGALHQAGIAREFEVMGTSRPEEIGFELEVPANSVTGRAEAAPEAEGPSTGFLSAGGRGRRAL